MQLLLTCAERELMLYFIWFLRVGVRFRTLQLIDQDEAATSAGEERKKHRQSNRS